MKTIFMIAAFLVVLAVIVRIAVRGQWPRRTNPLDDYKPVVQDRAFDPDEPWWKER